MAPPVRIALDAMGGDFGPAATIAGAALALQRRPDTFFLLFGDGTAISAELAAFPALAERSEVRHSAVSIRMDEKPSVALRQGRRVSSMWMAIEAVKKGEADAAVSAGNTGALMAMAKICLRTLPGIDRPALAALWHLVDLAIMGSAMARIILHVERPTVGLLNVGTEEIKGVEEVKAASKLLKDARLPNLDYQGFVEGDSIGQGVVDVVVTEGFAGNIALKTAEGTATQIKNLLRDAMRRSLLTKLGALLARGAFEEMRAKLDTRNVNGGVFLGLNGVVIKSHGGMDAIGFARAVEIGYEMVRNELLAKIRDTATIAHEHDNAASLEETSDSSALSSPPSAGI